MSSNLVAEICLYGNRTVGAGWLARIDRAADATMPWWADGLIGTGEPVEGRSFTEAVWAAIDTIRTGVQAGIVRIFDAGGRRMVDVDLNDVPAYGDLKWTAAVVHVIPSQDVEAAAAL